VRRRRYLLNRVRVSEWLVRSQSLLASTVPYVLAMATSTGSTDSAGWTVVQASPGGVAQLVERVLSRSTRRAVPERSWVQSLLPTTEVEPGFSTFGGMLVPVLQLISPVCKTGTSL
jgi:hypothetical protein